MGKFLSRFALGAVLGLFAIWLWGQLNQDDDDDFEDDDEVIEIPIGNNKQASAAASAQDDKADGGVATHAKVAAPAPNNAKAEGSTDSMAANLEWVDGIGQAFNRILSAAGIKTDQDLANASLEQLRATGIQRNDEEFASWIKQAKQRVSGK